MDNLNNKNGMPLLGDSFPKMTVQTTRGEYELPTYYKGKWFIFFSHPAVVQPPINWTRVFFSIKRKKLKRGTIEYSG